MSHLILYSTLGCHLCEQARALSEPLLAKFGMQLIEVDIAEDHELLEVYGLRIPVLRNPADNTELSWPFDTDELLAWVKTAEH